MGPGEVREHCRVGSAAQGLLKAATQQHQLSARGYHRVLKLARTTADPAGPSEIGPAHVAEATCPTQDRVRM